MRVIDNDFLPEGDSCGNPVSFLAQDTRVRGCNEVIVAVIGGERVKWRFWNAMECMDLRLQESYK